MEKDSWRGHLRKMKTFLEGGNAQYLLRLYNNLLPLHEIYLNDLVGKKIEICFTGSINCIETGRSITKTYGEGLSYEAFISSANAVESIIRPELSKAHFGEALRDWAWERDHDIQPHYVYLSKTSEVKVGVTRGFNLNSRWVDQGAIEGLIFAETPYRHAAGAIEVACKAFLSDKTNWRNMLTNSIIENKNLQEVKKEIASKIPYEFKHFIVDNALVQLINFPVITYPKKVSSFKLDKTNRYVGQLNGIKGQYLIFDHGNVINLRSHAGYEVIISII